MLPQHQISKMLHAENEPVCVRECVYVCVCLCVCVWLQGNGDSSMPWCCFIYFSVDNFNFFKGGPEISQNMLQSLER
jgi:hypothetical protein